MADDGEEGEDGGGNGGTAAFASPPCLMHEVDPAYMGLEPPADASGEGGARPAPQPHGPGRAVAGVALLGRGFRRVSRWLGGLGRAHHRS